MNLVGKSAGSALDTLVGAQANDREYIAAIKDTGAGSIQKTDLTTRSIAEMQTNYIDIDVKTAATSYPYSHGLKRTPNGYIKISQSVAGSIYHSVNDESKWDDKTITLQADTVGKYRLMLV